MLLTLSAKSFAGQLAGGEADDLTLADLPAIARDEFGLQGLTIQTELLSGWTAPQVDRLRDAADKQGCPCLLLVESADQPLGHEESDKVDAALERMSRVVRVASRLGCSAVAMPVERLQDDDDNRDEVAARVRQVLSHAERLEVNVLISPDCDGVGLTGSPESLTALIRKVGGFRVGSFPDLGTASRMPDPVAYLKSIVPYASALVLPAGDEQSDAIDHAACFEALRTVGFSANLTLEWRGGPDAVAGLEHLRAIVDEQLSQEAAE
ncbi:MAG: TIM barrel protein [Planctomycetota bacterium]